MPFGDSGLLAVLGLLALFGVLTMMLRRSYRQLLQRGEGGPASGKPSRPQRGGAAEAPREYVDWEVAMHDTARELSARLDSKMAALQQLIADADRAAARLEKLRGESRERTVQSPELRVQSPESVVECGEDAGVSAAQRDQVGVLSDYGFAPAEIARRLDLSPPQIEHILRSRVEGPKPFSNP